MNYILSRYNSIYYHIFRSNERNICRLTEKQRREGTMRKTLGRFALLSTVLIASVCTVCYHYVVQNYQARAAVTKTVVVTVADLDNTSSNPTLVAADGLNKWFMYNDTNDTIDNGNTFGSFVVGPGTPPLGRGSVQFT